MYDDSCKVAFLHRYFLLEKCPVLVDGVAAMPDAGSNEAARSPPKIRVKQPPGTTRHDTPGQAKHCGQSAAPDARNSIGRRCIEASSQLSLHHRRSTVNRRTYQQPRNYRERCASPPLEPRTCAATLNRARATTRRVPRSRARMESRPDGTAATCAAPSRDAPRSGLRANRSRNRSRRPIRRTRAHASRA